MKAILSIQAILILTGSLLVLFFSAWQSALSFAAGSGLVLVNLLLLTYLWTAMLNKKLIALSLVIIVFKYALLAGLIYWIAKEGLLDLQWLSLGLATLVITSLVSRTVKFGN